MESSSSTLLPRHVGDGSSGAVHIASSDDDKYRRRRPRPPPSSRTKPPSQDRLVVEFVAASAVFALASISPFLFGNFPSHVADDVAWMHKHGDGKGGVLDLAGNKTLLAWHYLVGQQKQQQQSGGENNNDEEVESASDSVGRDDDSPLPLARGISGLPLSKTPALIGAQHGIIQCKRETKLRMDELAYWNEPQGDRDASFISPFAPKDRTEKRYVTFEPDRGGWNNIRMSLEIVIVFAAATGRTLVLPPDTPFYLLTKKTEEQKARGNARHGFADFLDLDSEALRRKVDMITMKQFLERESNEKMFTIPSGKAGDKIWKASEQCLYVEKSDRPCESVYGFLRDQEYVPELQAGRDCLIFDLDKQPAKDSAEYTDEEIFDLMPEADQGRIRDFCDKRNPIFFGNELATAPLIHFHAGEKHHRLLNHFYTFLYFPDVKLDHYFKRFVRDHLHYTDEIWCAAGKVIDLLEVESRKSSGLKALKGTAPPGSGFSTMHVRRGDFQYKKQKITADDWYENTKDLFEPKETIYIATDEKNKSWFDPLAKHYNVRFLNDFTESAGLKELDPNLMGMIDTIVASRGRLFVGTWFSTFTGYINRMRGYYGMPGGTSYYSAPDRKLNTHQWEDPHKVMTAREWPTAWVGIDGDEVVTQEGTL